MDSLDALLAAAKAAEPNDRIDFRNPIAEHGGSAVAALVPWLSDRELVNFAILTIGAAGRRARARRQRPPFDRLRIRGQSPSLISLRRSWTALARKAAWARCQREDPPISDRCRA